jgi:hypothetical protein
MSHTPKQQPITYTMGFSIAEHPLADGKSINVAFLSTLARITRNGANDYKLETTGPEDLKTPGLRAPHGSYTNFAVANIALGCQYSEGSEKTHAKANHLTTDEVDACMEKISSMLVNTQQYHDEELARRAEEANPLVADGAGENAIIPHEPPSPPTRKPILQRFADRVRGTGKLVADIDSGEWQRRLAEGMIAQQEAERARSGGK